MPTLLPAIALTCVAVVTTSATCGPGESGLPTEPSPSLGKTFEFRVGDTAEIEGTDLSLTFTEVRSDSRCPEDVVCVREGEATVVFQARTSGGQSEEVTFQVPPKGSATGRFQRYVIEILELQPQARSQRKIEPEEYVAKVRVSIEVTR